MCRNPGPKSSLFWAVRCDEESDPPGRIFGVLHPPEDAVAEAALLVDQLPVDVDMAEARLDEDLAQFRDGPLAPIIRERPTDSAPVPELEMDVEAGEVLHRIGALELPDVGETPVARALPHRFLGFPASENIADEQAARRQRLPRRLEVPAQLISFEENEVREVQRHHQVHPGTGDIEHVLAEERHARALLIGEAREIVFLAPRQRGRIEVDADGRVGAPAFHPLGGEQRRAAEVFLEQRRRSAVSLAINAVEKAKVDVGTLDGFLVQPVFVTRLGSPYRTFLATSHGTTSKKSRETYRMAGLPSV